MLSLDWNLLCNIINIFILLFVVKKFLFKPVDAILKARQDEVEKELSDAAKVKEDADALKITYEKSVSESKETREEIISEARKDAQSEYSRILEEAGLAAEQMKDKAKEEALQEKKKLLKKADTEISNLVISVAEKFMSNGNTMNQQLYEQFINKTGESSETENN